MPSSHLEGTAPRGRLGRARARLGDALPQGRLLPDEVWRRRHRGLVLLLWLHVPALAAFGTLQGKGLLHSVLEAQIVAAFALLAGWRGASRAVRSGAASVGLVTCSAVLVHLWGGTTEGHFHFFVVVSLLILYQDWLPFLVAIAYVVGHHGVLGVLAPTDVYGSAAAAADPWLWAAIHGGFVLAACAANVVSWRANELLLHDPLTGLASRILLNDRLELGLTRARRAGRPLALLFLDLDRFKLVNDSLGHSAGDRLLQLVSARLDACVRGTDTAVRFGGDEFAVLCEDIGGTREAVLLAQRILGALAQPYAVGGEELVVSASIGIAVWEHGPCTPEELMRDADTAMYRAKQRGKNRVEVFDPEVRASLLDEIGLDQDLRRALARGELRLHYQPEVSLATGRIVGVEALMRWQHPDRGLVPPLEFIPHAEATGLVVPMGAWAIEEACRQAERWGAAGAADDLTIRVNVSAAQLADPAFAETVAAALGETSIAPARLCLEITESALADACAPAVLGALRRLGVRLAVDDFGTGYSSLDRLRGFDLDVLKIDRTFVSGLDARADDAAIVAAIVAMAHALGLSVTAEGVEEVGQLARLRELGCDAAQGFLFARPAPGEDLLALLCGGADVAGIAA